ncbi:PIR Superfamily Protein [Plasmodium ovale wallikeri]|uniref:PIR Superfamily Protein n=1 Tax=Plasmodium ovale wallikeri TaxID=864142 RepID=A0A1A8YJ35_PLAOA|nr:PIR Superfamily Protein [Plasmodium ovale wallikeri]SBT31537.1 PIR Superfamily Protein [Plasmodium ovale wallikeri]
MNNETFNGIYNYDKIYCFDLKYWLYDQIKKHNIKVLSINNLFEEWQSSIKDKVFGIRSAPCTYRELN